MSQIPQHTPAIWEGGKVVNKGGLPLWSGKAPPPEVGAVVTCADKKGTQCRVTGYTVQEGWLLVEGVRLSDGFEGNLAGAEIL